MRPAWVICVTIPQITKYNLWKSSWLCWLLNTAEPKATLLLCTLLSHMDNHIPCAPIHKTQHSQMENKGSHDNL